MPGDKVVSFVKVLMPKVGRAAHSLQGMLSVKVADMERGSGMRTVKSGRINGSSMVLITNVGPMIRVKRRKINKRAKKKVQMLCYRTTLSVRGRAEPGVKDSPQRFQK